MKEGWEVEFVNKTAEDEALNLSADLRAKFVYISEMLKNFGPHQVGLPYIRPLGNKLWEMRLKGKDNRARSIYILASNRRIIVVHTFIKKTQTTPPKALAIVKRRLKELHND